MFVPAFSWPAVADENLPAAVALAVENHSGAGQIFCSGVPIRQDVVLTAAHCIHQFKQHWPEHTLVIKSDSEKTNSIQVRKWSIHPQFQQAPNHRVPDIDVALLTLARPLTHKGNNGTDFPNEHLGHNSTFWMKGYSPIRLKSDSVDVTMNSPKKWERLNYERELPREGKFQLRAASLESAPCAGDSGAPLWSFEKDTRQLKAVVVQGNCSGGKANAVALESLSQWLQETLSTFNEYRSAALELWKIYPKHLFAGDHN